MTAKAVASHRTPNCPVLLVLQGRFRITCSDIQDAAVVSELQVEGSGFGFDPLSVDSVIRFAFSYWHFSGERLRGK